jgi:hypothetical protein
MAKSSKSSEDFGSEFLGKVRSAHGRCILHLLENRNRHQALEWDQRGGKEDRTCYQISFSVE